MVSVCFQPAHTYLTSQGNFVKDIESVIVTHNSDEASMFVPGLVRDRPDSFEKEIASLYGDSPAALTKIRKRYDISKYANNQEQITHYMDSSYFVCNVRNIAKAYAGKSWVGQYSRGTGKHGTDIRVLFFNATAGEPKDDPGLLQFAPKFQSYFLSHALTGDVNARRVEGTVEWPFADVGATYRNVVDANTTFSLIEDQQLDNEVCDFWLDVWRTVASGL
jgi:carboxylesterase type B